MVSDSPAATTDWGPYRFTAAALAVALALNLWTGNTLWLWYTVLGTSLFLLAVGRVRLRRLHPPRRAVWMVGLAASLHYVGGSLSGLHQIGGSNGLYYAFPWWDNMVHVLGSAAVGVAAAAGLLRLLPGRPVLVGALSACVGVAAGTLVELYEFAQFEWFGTVDQGFYTNTVVDLYNNLVGASLGAILFLRSGRRQPLPLQPASSP
ncbi:MAG TPA: hypothetical protein VI796_00770 [Candidatus Thermoplasmatota archaeon]|nr:hypothetical protein [Candidatus Thermoplasmatota archaeon]